MEPHFAEIADSDNLDRPRTPPVTPPKESNNSDPATRNEPEHNQDLDGKDLSSRSLTTPTTVHYHHRRKRSRVSPLNRLSHFNDEQPYPCRMRTPTTDEHQRLDPIKDSSDEPDECADNETSFLNLPPLDSEFRDLLNKYVRSDSVVRSLELAGFSSPYVLIRLDETQLQKLEEFVGYACSSMKSIQLREQFTGPIFARNPTQFKLPSGAVCGILLAAGELRRRYRRSQLVSGSIPSTDLEHNLTYDPYDPDLVEVGCQTDITFPPVCSNGPISNSISCTNDLCPTTNHTSSCVDVDSSPPPPNAGLLFPTDTSTSRTGRTTSTTTTVINQTTGSPNQQIKLDNNVPTTSAGTAAIVAAALQAAAAAATVPTLDSTLFAPHSVDAGTTGLDAVAVSFASGLNCAFPSTFPNELCMGLHNSLNASTGAVRSSTTANSSGISTGGVGGGVNVNSSLTNQSNFVMATNANGGFDEELVDLERLKQHSSASAIRLASRQFINAYLMRGRDFDLEMELSITPEGCKRVTGIFYCHLCREKRERTSAVRFSIARNRYPVLSNVLSHLKTHFHYRGSMVSAPHHNNHHSHILHQTKSTTNLNDSFVGTGGATHSPNSFPNPSVTNCSGYRTELNLDPCNNTLSANSLNQFASHHIKPEAMNYAYQMDNGSADDSNHGHGGGVYDTLGGSPNRSLSSPIDKCSPQTGTGRNLRLDAPGTSLSDNVKNNSCNSLTS